MKKDKPARKAAAAPKNIGDLYDRIRSLIVAARQTVARGVDLVQVHTNFQIGRHIVEHEQQGKQRAGYGEKIVEALAERLTREFGKGFSKRNLELMRRFYLIYQERMPGIAQTASAQLLSAKKTQTVSEQSPAGMAVPMAVAEPPFGISWSHYVFLLGVNNPDERSFYEIEAANQGWITLPKDANIHAREYQLYLPSKEELQRKLVEWAGEAGQHSTDEHAEGAK